MNKFIYLAILLAVFSLQVLAQNSSSGNENTPKNTGSSTGTINKLPLYNLFYLSKLITNGETELELQDLVYSALIQQIGKAKASSLLSDTIHKNSSKFFKNYDDNIKLNFLDDSTSSNKGKTPLQNKKRELESLTSNLSILDKRIKDLKDIKSILDTLKEKNLGTKTTDSLFREKENLLMKKLSTKSFGLVSNDIKLSSPKIGPSDFINIKTNIHIEINNLDSFRIKLQENVSNREKKYQFSLDSAINKKLNSMATYKSNIAINETLDAKQRETTQISIITAAQNAQQSLSYSGLSMPSQSQLIDAMAIFLAKRAKQEAAIWFMDQLRERIKNPLIFDTFPETIALLDNLEDYHTANFGKSWRYAIATDFVKLPENLVNGTWVTQTLSDSTRKELQTAIRFGTDLNRLIMERYNYRDIIRNLYLDPAYNIKPDITKPDSLKIKSVTPLTLSKSLRKSLVLLYIATNELFTLQQVNQNDVYRLLSYEEIKTMDGEQWKTFIELLRLKYGDEFSELYNSVSHETKDQAVVLKWISSLLMSLNQFDRINHELQQVPTKDKLEFSAQSVTGIWKVLDQVIKGIDITPFANPQKVSEFSLHIENVTKTMEIMGDIQSQNFVHAAKKSLALIDNFYNAATSSATNGLNFDPKTISIKNGLITYAVKKDSVTISKFANNLTHFSVDPIEKGWTVKYHFKKGADSTIIMSPVDLQLINRINLVVQHLNKSETKKILNELKKEGKSDSPALKLIEKCIDEEEFSPINIIALYTRLKEQSAINEVQTVLASYNKKFNFDIPLNFDKLMQTKDFEFGRNYMNKYGTQLLKLTSFFGDVMASKDAEALSEVIDSYALPPTSYKLKQKMTKSIDLNAYVGAFGGYLWAYKNSSFGSKWTGGITAPIGVTIKDNGLFKCINLNIQLVDLGNIVNHYLVTPDVVYNKEVHFTEVLSPGLNLLYSLKNTPIVLFGGVKLLPLKSYLDPNTQITMNDRAFDVRVFSLGLKLDIPLINLYAVGK